MEVPTNLFSPLSDNINLKPTEDIQVKKDDQEEKLNKNDEIIELDKDVDAKRPQIISFIERARPPND